MCEAEKRWLEVKSKEWEAEGINDTMSRKRTHKIDKF